MTLVAVAIGDLRANTLSIAFGADRIVHTIDCNARAGAWARAYKASEPVAIGVECLDMKPKQADIEAASLKQIP